MRRSLTCALLVAASCLAGEKKALAPARAANDAVEITATAVLGKEAVEQAVGSDLGGDVVIVEVRLTPKGEKPIAVNRDDFTLRSDKDGQKAQPFAPSQLAGSGALVVRMERAGGGMAENAGGPVWGGMGGGMPGRLPGNGGSVGSATSGAQTATATAPTGANEKESPLLRTLKEKVLPEKETREPVAGMLYFPMEGKQKAKDLELVYKTPAGKLSLRFPR
jgi:hypothetical protein